MFIRVDTFHLLQEVQVQLLTHRNTIQNHTTAFPGFGGSNPTMGTTRDSMSMLTLSDAASYEHQSHHVANGGTEIKGGGSPEDGFGSHGGDSDSSADNRAGFALVVNGHSLVYALSEELELLFLSVAEKCNGNFFFLSKLQLMNK